MEERFQHALLLGGEDGLERIAVFADQEPEDNLRLCRLAVLGESLGA